MTDATKLIERLRYANVSFATLKMNALEAADLIEQQAAKIVELENKYEEEAFSSGRMREQIHLLTTQSRRYRDRIATLEQTLREIANADTVEWDDPTEFEAWSKSRARHTLSASAEKTGE